MALEVTRRARGRAGWEEISPFLDMCVWDVGGALRCGGGWFRFYQQLIRVVRVAGG